MLFLFLLVLGPLFRSAFEVTLLEWPSWRSFFPLDGTYLHGNFILLTFP